MRQALGQRPVSGYLRVEIPAPSGRAARPATVAGPYGDLPLRPPSRAPTCQARLRPITVSVVWVPEIDVAGDGEPLAWL